MQHIFDKFGVLIASRCNTVSVHHLDVTGRNDVDQVDIQEGPRRCQRGSLLLSGKEDPRSTRGTLQSAESRAELKESKSGRRIAPRIGQSKYT